MNLICLFRRHNWKFSYNHGMPLGTGTEAALDMLRQDKSFAVYRCTRPGCRKQARLVEGKMTTLNRGQIESP